MFSGNRGGNQKAATSHGIRQRGGLNQNKQALDVLLIANIDLTSAVTCRELSEDVVGEKSSDQHSVLESIGLSIHRLAAFIRALKQKPEFDEDFPWRFFLLGPVRRFSLMTLWP